MKEGIPCDPKTCKQNPRQLSLNAIVGIWVAAYLFICAVGWTLSWLDTAPGDLMDFKALGPVGDFFGGLANAAALVALVVTLVLQRQELELQRRLSVRPQLVLSGSVDRESGLVELESTNTGHGPATILSARFWDASEEKETLPVSAENFCQVGFQLPVGTKGTFAMTPGAQQVVGGAATVIYLKLPRALTQDEFGQIPGVMVRYADMFGNEMPCAFAALGPAKTLDLIKPAGVAAPEAG